MVISSGSNYEQSLLHILGNMVPEAMSDAEMVLHMSQGIMGKDGRRRLIVVGHTLPRTELAELLECDIPKHFFSGAYERETMRRHGYLVVDLYPTTPDRCRLRMNIFPDENN